jgi:hypothetical protein
MLMPARDLMVPSGLDSKDGTCEIELGTLTKGKPVRKAGTQSHRSKGVTA